MGVSGVGVYFCFSALYEAVSSSKSLLFIDIKVLSTLYTMDMIDL